MWRCDVLAGSIHHQDWKVDMAFAVDPRTEDMRNDDGDGSDPPWTPAVVEDLEALFRTRRLKRSAHVAAGGRKRRSRQRPGRPRLNRRWICHARHDGKPARRIGFALSLVCDPYRLAAAYAKISTTYLMRLTSVIDCPLKTENFPDNWRRHWIDYTQ